MSNRALEKKRLESSLEEHMSNKLYSFMETSREKNTRNYNASDNDAIVRIMEYYQVEHSNLNVDQMSSSRLDSTLMDLGIFSRKTELEKDWWKKGELPLILEDKEGKSYPVIPRSNGHYILSIDGKEKEMTKKMAEGFSCYATSYYQVLPKNTFGMHNFYKLLFESVYKSDIARLCLMSLFVAIVGLILPFINANLYSVLIPSREFKSIWGLVILLFGSTCFAALLNVLKGTCNARITNRIKMVGQSAIVARVFQLPVSFFKKYDSGDLFCRIFAVKDMCDIMGEKILPAAISALFSLMYFFSIGNYANEMLLPSLLILGVNVTILYVQSKLWFRFSQKKKKAQSGIISKLYQFLDGIRQIRVSGSQTRFFVEWEKSFRKVPIMGTPFLRLMPAINLAILIISNIVFYLIGWAREIGPSDYIAFATAYGVLSASVLELGDIARLRGELNTAADMVAPILEEPVENPEYKDYIASLEGELEFSHVDFRYRPELPVVLKNLSFKIKKGEYVGIVGASGCGKSTIIRLLTGFEEPNKGSIYYDGKNINQIDLVALRANLGVVLQETTLFAGKIEENLKIGNPLATEEEIWQVLELVGMKQEIEQMPMKLHTVLMENGAGISGGQKQRLLIARALLGKPRVLLFDESTSALDNLSQDMVVASMKKIDCTKVVVAHRLSTIKDCDRILYLENGAVVEEGTYQELMDKKGAFYEMASRQLL